ncbi:MAG: hypothetical protein PF481_05845 [Bacteroidales bacterium]|nr:hypothetical protein [Bacteroidales bacterium]
MIYFQDGEVTFVDDGLGNGAFDHSVSAGDNELIMFGSPLNTSAVPTLSNWSVSSSDDANYGSGGQQPIAVHRKSKLTGMSQENWNTSTNDYDYDWAYEHTVFLQLPNSLVSGTTYTVSIQNTLNSDVTEVSFTYNVTSTVSESIHINLAGYSSSESIKSADVYMWMGDGGTRDYSSFEGNKVFVYDIAAQTSQEVGSLSFWQSETPEFSHNHEMIRGSVWNADFTGFNTPGTYRLVVEGVGCSQEFEISPQAYAIPFKVSTQGFFYMRIGEDGTGVSPIPRRPLWIPDVSPTDCKVYITTMHPYHPEWDGMCGGDKWDCKDEWAQYSTGRENPNAYGGHSDALDWDRHLGHVAIIYDMLLPYILSDGLLSEDDLDIAESGNGIPDVLDEARNEVDFWLRLRDGKGYSHGLNNPNGSNVLYQGGNTAVAAWANATNSAMLSHSFQISGHTSLFEAYRDSAIAAYTYASSLSDQMLTNSQNIGSGNMTGADFKATAAAFLYNITGNTVYEDDLNALSLCTSPSSTVLSNSRNQLYASAAYLFSKQTINYPTLFTNMKASIIAEAKQNEANYSTTRPSRRACDNSQIWFFTEMVIQRSILAHAVTENTADKDLFENALVLEADWSLGRNPLNMIQMTTATTELADIRSVPNAYTSGWDDGTPGVHPGHTPYMNIFDWGGTMVMGNPTWMTEKNYPIVDNWPYAEMYYNTRYVYAANEFTPQQTMRGKQALYGYLHAISPLMQEGCAVPDLSASSETICGYDDVTIESGLNSDAKTFIWYKDGVVLSSETNPSITVIEGGLYSVDVDSAGCVSSDQISIDAALNVDLGEDKVLCTETEFILDAQNSTVPGITYEWSTLETSREIVVKTAGEYSVIVSAQHCANATDAVIITTNLLEVIGDTICEPGTATLQVVGSDLYSWYDQSVGGVELESGTTYNPSITETSMFYATQTTGFLGDLGKPEQGTGDAWGLGAADLGGTDKINNVTVSQALTLESIAVYVSADGTDVTINLSQGGTVVHTATVTGLDAGKQTIPLNFNLLSGDYVIDAVGTTGALVFEASGAVFPYEYAEYISFTYNEDWQSDWYGLFYDWQFSAGSSCARTPVEAVIDSNNPSCTGEQTQEIELQAGWNLISTYILAQDNSIESLFATLDVRVVKSSSGFWKNGQEQQFNSVSTIEPGKGYLVYMNSLEIMSITGTAMEESFTVPQENGWLLIGCPFKNTSSFDTYFNSSNCTVIKNFEGFWEPESTLPSLSEMVPGRGYYLLR